MHHATKIAAVCAAAALAACVSMGTKVKTSQLAQFHKGVTTETQVEQALGKPQSETLNSSGTTSIVYTYSHATADAIDYVPIVGLFAGGAKGEQTNVTFTFDKGGKLLSFTATHAQQHVHTF